jgi:hypothetical protein
MFAECLGLLAPVESSVRTKCVGDEQLSSKLFHPSVILVSLSGLRQRVTVALDGTPVGSVVCYS